MRMAESRSSSCFERRYFLSTTALWSRWHWNSSRDPRGILLRCIAACRSNSPSSTSDVVNRANLCSSLIRENKKKTQTDKENKQTTNVRAEKRSAFTKSAASPVCSYQTKKTDNIM